MAAIKKRRWWKKDIGYQFLDTRDFGQGLRQADIERLFARACDKWAPHCGLNFHKVGSNPDLRVNWGNLGRKNGNIVGGQVDGSPTPPILTFSDDAHWMATQFDKDFMDFLYCALHELGHAIGLDHSEDKDAIMYPIYEHPSGGLPFLQGLSYDDAVAARWLYTGDGSLSEHPENPLADMISALYNKTQTSVEYKMYLTGDPIMGLDLGHGSIEPGHVTYWKERSGAMNANRKYRVRVDGGGERALLDDVPPLVTLTIVRNKQNKLAIFYPALPRDQWP